MPTARTPGLMPKPKAPSQATPWSSSNNPNTPQQGGPTLTPSQQAALTPPPVPSQTEPGGKVVVNTDALDAFAHNVNLLISPVEDALNTATGLPNVAAGGFPDAYTISDQVSGSGSGSGSNLRDSYKLLLNYLSNGLTDIVNAADSTSKTYATADELNNATAADVTKALSTANNDFSSMLGADGGSAAPPSSSALPPSGSGA